MPSPSPGFDASGVSPADAVVTLRSLRRRFTEAFDQAEAPEDVTRPGGDGHSPLGRAAWVTRALGEIGEVLRQVSVADNPPVQLPSTDPPAEGGEDAGGVEAVLAALGETATAVADRMAAVHGDDWRRRGLAAGREVSALDIARLGVAIGIDQLRAAQAALGAERG